MDTQTDRTVYLIVSVDVDADLDQTDEEVRDEVRRLVPFATVDLPGA